MIPAADEEADPSPADGDDAAQLESQLPELSEGEFPPFVVNAAQRRRWRLALAITRRIAGYDDLTFAEQIFRGDLPTHSDSEEGAAKSEKLLNEPAATCTMSSDDAPWVA